MGVAANIACLLAILLDPYMPAISKVMHEQMNSPKSINVITDSIVRLLPAGHKIGKVHPIALIFIFFKLQYVVAALIYIIH